MTVPVVVERIEKDFGAYPALRGVSLKVQTGELIALLGPSGSGKTTLLRVVAGLEQPERGRVLFGDVDVSTLSLRDRRIGFVFQHYALFRHMSVLDNVAFGLRVRPRHTRPPAEEIKRRASCSSSCNSPASRRATRASSPVDNASGSRWRARLRSSHRCCCSTSRSGR